MEPSRIHRLDFLTRPKAAPVTMLALSNPSCCRKKKKDAVSLVPKIIRELLDGYSPTDRMTVSGDSCHDTILI